MLIYERVNCHISITTIDAGPQKGIIHDNSPYTHHHLYGEVVSWGRDQIYPESWLERNLQEKGEALSMANDANGCNGRVSMILYVMNNRCLESFGGIV